MKKQQFKKCAGAAALMMTVAGCGAQAALLPEPQLVKVLSSDVAKNVSSLGGSLLETMKADGNGNILISPVSVYLCYAMLYNGLQAESAAELQNNLFYFPKALETHNGDCQYLMTYLQENRTDTTLNIANALFLDQAFEKELNPDYAAYNQKYLQARVQALDFADGGSVDIINQWVYDSTGGMIPSMVDTLKPEDCLYLLNGLYLEAKWETPFQPHQTMDGIFHSPGKEQTVPMMNLKGTLDYFEDETMQAVRLPYSDGKTSMLVVLPKPDVQLAQPFSDMGTLIEKIKPTDDIWLTLPKVDLAYSDEGSLMDALKAGGVRSIFTPGQANLTGIADVNPPLYVSETKHKTALKIDEEGTKAAAATSIGIARASMDRTTYQQMLVDAPFYCAVYDDLSGMLLFCGKISSISV